MKRTMFLAAAAAAGLAAPAIADVKQGIEAWQRGDYAAAVKEWQPAATAGDADAEFNLGQAYKLGKGVPADVAKAQGWYKKAAEQGHVQATAQYGLILFQNGDRAAAMPWLRKAADKGDPRAQYVVGTALFNGDFGPKDWPHAYAYMTRASAAGLPQAGNSLQQMDQYLSADDKQKGLALAQTMAQPTPVVGSLAQAQAIQKAGPALPGTTPGIQAFSLPPSQPETANEATPSPRGGKRVKPSAAATPPAVETASAAPAPERKAKTDEAAVAKPKAETAAPKVKAETTAAAPASGGKWRIQLGAYGSAGAAEAAWKKASGALGGFSHYTSAAGAMTRLQAGPFASKAAATKGCAAAQAAGLACFAVPTR
ncbi:MAG: SEL1-like repeat protein [Sphingomonadaceae bacterium]|nr:SEL1-like repeat protein [Sphingomonadaceae bacterium]